jgi:hypothetical protein
VTNNGYRCFPLDKTGRLVCDRPVIASVAAADRRVTDTWMDLVCDGAEEAEPLRRTVTEHWTPLGTPPPHWMRLKTELRELSARLEDADDAFDVRGNLDARRHARITEKLTLKVTQTEDAIATAEPTLDTTRLRDRDYVARRWAAHAPPVAGHYSVWPGARFTSRKPPDPAAVSARAASPTTPAQRRILTAVGQLCCMERPDGEPRGPAHLAVGGSISTNLPRWDARMPSLAILRIVL